MIPLSKKQIFPIGLCLTFHRTAWEDQSMKQNSWQSRLWIRVVGCVIAACVSFLPLTHAGARRPNILLIVTDDLGWGDLSCYGAKDLKTPHIDRLAAEGMRWTRFYANSCVCSPTRAAILTGRYPECVGVPGVIRTHPENSWGWLSPKAVLLPQVLHQAGYFCGIIGKWHLGLESPNTPLDRGFDFFHGFLGDMMDDYYTHRRHGINYMRRNREVIDPEGHATDLFTQWACDFLRARAREDRPFFLYLAYNAPHVPIQPPPEWLDRVHQQFPHLSERRARLVALIEHLDAGIGRVLQTLDELGMTEHTLVLFTSDNGGQISVGAHNGPWRAGKGTMYEGGLRVPFLARWPGRILPKTVCDAPAMTMDLFPTVCSGAGVRIHHRIDGIDLMPVLLSSVPLSKQNENQLSDPIAKNAIQKLRARTMFFIRREGGTAFGGQTIQAVTEGPWKLLQNSPWKPLELYNLSQDPQEQQNVIHRYPKVYRQLLAKMMRQIQRGGAVPWQPPEREILTEQE